MFTKHFRRKSLFFMNSSRNIPIITAQLQSETLGEIYMPAATATATTITTLPSIYKIASDPEMTTDTSVSSLWSTSSSSSSSSSSASSSSTTTMTWPLSSTSTPTSTSISLTSSAGLLSTYPLCSNTIKFWRIFTIISCLLILFVNKISSAGYFELEILEISNTNSHLLNGYCCGVPLSIRNTKTTGCPSCSTAFRLCLKEYSAVDLGVTTTSIGCSFGNSTTSILGGSSFVLSDPGRGAIVLPFTFRWTKSFTLILQALDMYNTSFPESERLIEEASFSGVILPSPEWKTLDHIGRNARITYRVRVQCATTYYNTTCTTFCRQRNDQFGHYTCGTQGEKICLNGWTGDNCEIAICKPGCDPIHGYCQQPGECDCRQGWQGPLCNECKVYPGCKHGSCDGTAWTCRCDTNWGGILCDQDLNYCGTHEPCKHGGTCQNTAPDKFHCTCAEGLSGERCEIVEHPCATQPCKNGGTCTVKESTLLNITTILPYRTMHGMSSAMGKPVSGHSLSLTLKGLVKNQITTNATRSNDRSMSRENRKGTTNNSGISINSNNNNNNKNNADNNIISDSNITTLNNGSKINNNNNKNNNNHYNHHQRQYQHRQQQQQQQQKHQQQQISLAAEFTCACTPGWTGPTCEINIDECAGGPCSHGGTCIDLIGGFRCECPPEWTGDVCQVDINECEIIYPSVHFNLKPMYATTVAATTATITRNIASDATSKSQTSIVNNKSASSSSPELIKSFNIAPSNLVTITTNGNATNDNIMQLGPCINAHKCINLPGSFQCICLEGWGGPTCAKDFDDCLGQCKNGATCIDLVNDYHCACATGFTGRDCETDIDECANMPCRNGGECVDMVGKFNCICPLGYSGTLCEEANDHCTPSPCLQGRCLNTPGSYYCHCPPGRSGKHCEMNRTLCSQPYCNENGCFSNNSTTRNNLPCNGHGNCEIGTAGRFCKCHTGYTGTFCEHNLNECTPNPCRNGGICMDGDGDFTCECTPGWAGKRCSEQATECFEGQCKNGGICVRSVSTKSRNNLAHCRCAAGWEGIYCTEAIDQCRDQPCHNGGTCESGTGWFRCVCAVGFSGPDCRINVNECSPQPCQGGATCIDGIGGFTCICPAGRHGLRCEILLSESKLSCINTTVTTASPYSPLNTSQDILTQILMGHTDDNCNSCLCDNGTSRCSNLWCGLPNCFKNTISGSCKQHEVCVPSLNENCLKGPCPLRGDCRALEPSHRVAPPRLPAHPDCWPNQATLKDNCARLTILLDKARLSPGSSVEGLCSVIRFLLGSKLITSPNQKIEGTLIVICDLKIETNDTIEVTVSSTEINDSPLPLAVNLIGELLSSRQLNKPDSNNELKSTNLAALVSVLEVKVETASVAEAKSISLLIGILCGIFLVLIGLAMCLSLLFRQRIIISSTSGINLAPSLDALRHEEEKSNNLQNEENLRRYTNPLKGSTASLSRLNGIELNLNPTPELKAGMSSLSVIPTTSTTLHHSQPLYPACESNFDNELEVVTTGNTKEFHTKRSSQILLHKTQNLDMKKNTMSSIDSPRKDFGKRSINCKSMPLPSKVIILPSLTTTATNSITTNTSTTSTNNSSSNSIGNNCHDTEVLTVLV